MSDGSFEALLEHEQTQEAAREADAIAKGGPPGTKKTDLQKRIEDVLALAPKIGTREALVQLARIDPVIWTMFNRRLAGHGMTFDMARHLEPKVLAARRKQFSAGERGKKEFEREVVMTQQRHRPWQMEPLRDDHPWKAYQKGRQIGITEVSFTEAVCFLDQHPNTILMYTFPRDKQLETFATTRINPMFQETPRMRALLTGVNQVMTKKINQSHMVMRSAWESGLGEGVNVDVLVLDEKDRMKPGVEVAFRESMSSSEFGWLREVSTPTLPNRGVNASYLKSDQRQWFVRCARCGMKQPVTQQNIVQQVHLPFNCKELPPDSFAYVCAKQRCGGKLDRVHGEWVARHPNVSLVRGYLMPQMIAEWISATMVMQKRIDYKFVQLWMNYVLGEVSMGETVLLNERDFDMAEVSSMPLIGRRTNDWPLISVGIDWGHKNWVIVLGHNTNGRTYIINAKMFEDERGEPLNSVRAIDAWIEQFNPDIIIADDGFGKDRNAYLLKRYGEQRFFACRYNPAEKGGATFTPRWAPAANQVLCDRTMALKNLCRLIKDREIGFPGREYEIIQEVEAHLKALAPMMEEDDDGKIIEVVNATGDDHLAHGLFYAQLGLDYLRKTNHFNFDFG